MPVSKKRRKNKITRVGVIAFLRHPEDPKRYLFTRRTKAGKRGYWSLPGGNVEWGESPSEAIYREVLEETGMRGLHLAGKPALVETYTYENGLHSVLLVYMGTVFVGDVRKPFKRKAGRYSTKWLDKYEASKLKKLLPPLDLILNRLRRSSFI